MRLLIGDPDQVGELLLGEAEHDTTLAYPRTDVTVDILGPARRSSNSVAIMGTLWRQGGDAVIPSGVRRAEWQNTRGGNVLDGRWSRRPSAPWPEVGGERGLFNRTAACQRVGLRHRWVRPLPSREFASLEAHASLAPSI